MIGLLVNGTSEWYDDDPEKSLLLAKIRKTFTDSNVNLNKRHLRQVTFRMSLKVMEVIFQLFLSCGNAYINFYEGA